MTINAYTYYNTYYKGRKATFRKSLDHNNRVVVEGFFSWGWGSRP